MRSVLVAIAALAVGCGSPGSGTVDGDGGAGGGDDGGGGGDDGGGGGNQPSSVLLTLANRPNNGATFSFLVAYQDGSAPWQLAPAPTGDVYTLPIYAPSYGVAFACIGNAGGTTPSQIRSVTTAHFAVSERDALTLEVPARCSDRAPATVTLNGTIQNRPFGGYLAIQFGGRTAYASSQSGNFALQAPMGTHDLTVSHLVPQGNSTFYVDRVWMQRNVTLSSATTRTIDFNDAEPTTPYDVDTGPLPITFGMSASTTLYTANGSTLDLVRVSQSLRTSSLDDTQMVATDIYDQSISSGGVTVTNATSAPMDQTWMEPAQLGAIQTTIPTDQPYVTLETAWPAYANAVGYQWNATQQTACGNLPCTIAWSSYLSPGVLGAMPLYRMPDLSALTGWKPAFELTSGGQIVGGVTAVTSSAGAADFPNVTPPASGTQRTFARTDFATFPSLR